ncbi:MULTISPECIES: acyl-CoA thioesterase [unclassified Oceanispirochaeta]|uniref:acyl-CoA thioesterase n=1 Tax=unclassified Oceanispirochaeta TaxID=2635722 RepID=UPI000E09CBDB|nr:MULTISPECIES: hotdog domain-containing protein [unclassified Oceanispirochaeta]MBF9017362.1 acyl-CoA thioesterase [Oceanispirochaeta sp. M2]NPD73737.1 acyl-CoA thioesterase [Oceanispirochaeta sp. M1]RDG30490.1 acyl-CoA thioesterase [Oceanispirochaeta sp. M1]
MNTFNAVRSEHLNHHNYLFGGQMLFWVDENAWMTAARDFPGFRLVTRGMERISFEKSVINGSILRFHILPVNQGNSSVQYQVDVYADSPGEQSEVLVFSNKVTFVSVDCNGSKIPLPSREKLRSQLEDANPVAAPAAGNQPAQCNDQD